MLYVENEDQDHGVQYSQWLNLVANFNPNKSHTCAFSLTLTVFDIFTFENFDLENVGQIHHVQHLY